MMKTDQEKEILEIIAQYPDDFRKVLSILKAFKMCTGKNLEHCIKNAKTLESDLNKMRPQRRLEAPMIIVKPDFVNSAWALIGLAKQYPGALESMPEAELGARLLLASKPINQVRYLTPPASSTLRDAITTFQLTLYYNWHQRSNPKGELKGRRKSPDYSSRTDLAAILKKCFGSTLQNPRLYSSAKMDEFCADMEAPRFACKALLKVLGTTDSLTHLIDRRKTADFQGMYLPPLGSLGILTPEIFAELIRIDTIGYRDEPGSACIPEEERLATMQQIGHDLVHERFLRPLRDALQEIGMCEEKCIECEEETLKRMCEHIQETGQFDQEILLKQVQTMATSAEKELDHELVDRAVATLRKKLNSATHRAAQATTDRATHSRHGNPEFFMPAGEGSSSVRSGGAGPSRPGPG